MKLGGSIRSTRWRWAFVAALLAVAVGVLLASRWRDFGFEWQIFAETFRQLHLWWVAAAALLALATYLGRALRWEVMLRPLRKNASIWSLFTSTAIGFTAVVLFGRPGELVRPYLISVRQRVPFSSQIAAWFLERILDLLTVLLVFGFAMTQVPGTEAALGPNLSWIFRVGGYIIGGIGLVCVVVLFLIWRHSDTMRQRLLDGLGFLPASAFARVERIVTAFVQGVQSARSASFLLLLFLYTLLEWVLIGACYVCLFRAFPATAAFTLTDVLIFLGFVSIGSIVQIPGVGGGVQIASVIVLTELYQLPFAAATGVAILVWAITFVVIVPIGLLLAFQEGVNWQRLKELETEAQL